MKGTLVVVSTGGVEEYTDPENYGVDESGTLAVDAGQGRSVAYAPHYWRVAQWQEEEEE